MTEQYRCELLSNEFDAMHFGFSPRGFTDQVYNITVDAWAHTIENVFLKDSIVKTASSKDKKNLHEGLMDILFTTGGGAFQQLLLEFTNYTSHYIFRIPASVTLPVHKDVQILNAKELETGVAYSFKAQEKEAQAKEKEIILKKHALAEVTKRCLEADHAIEQMEKMLAFLKKRKEHKQQ